MALLGQLEIQSSIRVVQAQHRRLRVLVGAAVAVGQLTVALNLNRAAIVDTTTGKAVWRVGIDVAILWFAVHIVLRHFGERQNLVLRPATTGHPETGQANEAT